MMLDPVTMLEPEVMVMQRTEVMEPAILPEEMVQAILRPEAMAQAMMRPEVMAQAMLELMEVMAEAMVEPKITTMVERAAAKKRAPKTTSPNLTMESTPAKRKNHASNEKRASNEWRKSYFDFGSYVSKNSILIKFTEKLKGRKQK